MKIVNDIKSLRKLSSPEVFNLYITNNFLPTFDHEVIEEVISDKCFLIQLFSNGIYKLDLNTINQTSGEKRKGYFIHPIIVYIMNKCINCFKSDESFLKELLHKAIKLNEKVIESLISESIHYTEIDDNGYIKNGNIIVASLITVDMKSPIDVDDEVKMLIDDVNNQIEELKFNNRVFNVGYSNKNTCIMNGKVKKLSSNNIIEYEFLNLMAKNHYNKVPIYYGQEEGFDYFSYIEGNSKSSVYEVSKYEVEQILIALKEINTISKKILDDNKVFVHGDLSPMNAIFKGKKLQGIIDWDGCYIGHEYYDFIYVFWTWFNVGNYKRDDEKLFKNLLWMIDVYKPSKKFKKDFKEKMIAVMESRLLVFNKDDKQYKRIYRWVKWSEAWVELYANKIKEFIG